jgi:hypothetical protein
MTVFNGWENFYVIVGSSAGALIGLQFVVVTLIAETPIVRDMERAGSAFGTPTIIHFGSVLLLSAVISAPWHGIAGAAVLWGVLGLVGVVYVVIVARRYASTNRLLAGVRGPAVSYCVAVRSVWNASWIGLRGSLECWRGAFRGWCGGVAAALHRHS